MTIEKAEVLLSNRDFAGAKRVLRSLLLRNKVNKNAMYLLSIAEAELGNVGEALEILSRVIAIDAHHAAAHYTKANLLVSLSRHSDALSHHDRAVELLASNPWSFINRGISRAALKHFAAAIEDFDRAIALDPTLSAAFGNKASALLETNLVEQSHYFFDKAIELDPLNANALSGTSACLSKLKQPEKALILADRAIKYKSNLAEAHCNRGIALSELRRYGEAVASFDRAIALKPDFAEAWSNRGNALNDLRRYGEAVASFDQAIALRPDFAEAWSNCGVALHGLQRDEEAVASFDRAIELKPKHAESHYNRGNTLRDLQRHEEALVSYVRAFELKPDADEVLGNLLHTQMKLCDWTEFDQRCQTLENRLRRGDPASHPLPVLGLFDAPYLHHQCAKLWVGTKLSIKHELAPIDIRSRRGKIRIGYFSADFREHPVSHLMAELIETHNRDKFEIVGFSFGVNTGDTLRKRFEGAFDKFLEVRHLSELDIARLARDHEIDIAIDLNGFTQDSRPTIFAHRAAPIQINYLGFPGTMGTKYFHYFIGDRITVSDGNFEHFSERMMLLPNSFQANPSSRPIGSKESSRASYGLPENGLVFCCFNNVWKITPDVFKCWTNILRKVEGSVLWLKDDGQTAKRNLFRGAESAGICSDRIVFAGRLPCLSDHLNRYRLADVFLDTFPYGAHTTASDALWVGLPILTRAGESFASRVASSLLNAIGLPELITHTTEEYESLAVDLAKNLEKIQSLKARLAENRTTCPLFNTHLFTQHIESAYQAAYDRYHEGLAPDHIYVRPSQR